MANQVKVVEVGWNQHGHVCKVSFVLKSPECANGSLDDLYVTRDRILFISLGVDRGLKTFYITPGYKGRSNYDSRDGILTI